jgi:beta-N-acetylhexosaminidase
VRFVAAGGDVVLTVVPEQAPAMVRALARRAAASPRFGRAVAAAASRVLVRKARAGLVSCR